MKINKRFLHFKTLNAFEEALSQDRVLDDSIAFIADARLIWTHGEYYADKPADETQHIFMTQEQYDALDEYVKDAIYFILDYVPEEYGCRFGDKFPFKFSTSWVFGGEFPVILN